MCMCVGVILQRKRREWDEEERDMEREREREKILMCRSECIVNNICYVCKLVSILITYSQHVHVHV